MPHTRLTLLFDLDGTLVDSDPLHFQAFSRLLEETGKPKIDLDFYRTRLMGFGLAEIFPLLFPERVVSEYQPLADRKEKLFRDLVRDVQPTQGFVELLDWAKARDVRCGLVTNAPRENAMMLLRVLRVETRFDTMIFAEELPHAKPHPLPYLTALEQIGGAARSAIAFEDSLSGLKSATAAGIYTVGVRSSLSEKVLRSAGASHVIEDFRDTHLWSELYRLWSELYRHTRERSVQADG